MPYFHGLRRSRSTFFANVDRVLFARHKPPRKEQLSCLQYLVALCFVFFSFFMLFAFIRLMFQTSHGLVSTNAWAMLYQPDLNSSYPLFRLARDFFLPFRMKRIVCGEQPKFVILSCLAQEPSTDSCHLWLLCFTAIQPGKRIRLKQCFLAFTFELVRTN